MCGIAGIIDPSAETSAGDLALVARGMAHTVRHRGPDDDGVWVDADARVAFAFQRLAIVDLSAAGHQPFVSDDARFVLVFNGEVYNHRDLRRALPAPARGWRGHSDTETLMAALGVWGVRPTLERIVGMFALALWDRFERRLYLARDRFGEKPLYYGWVGNAFVFGSELAALRAHPAFDNDVDADVLALYTQYSQVPAPYSIFRHIYKLQPACLLSLNLGDAGRIRSHAPFAPVCDTGFTLDRYWSLVDVVRSGVADPLSDEREAIERAESALSDAVRLQAIADVPLGAFLSGGIDSSTIAALLQEQSGRAVRTFTVGFEDSAFDEARFARDVARHLGTEHTELYLSPEQVRAAIPVMPELYSEPFADSSQIPTYLISQLARRDVTVALSGDGGDEVFGGYNRYLWAPRIWNKLRWIPSPLRRRLGERVRRVRPSTWSGLERIFAGAVGVSRLSEKAQKMADRLSTTSDVDQLYRALVVNSRAMDVVPGAGMLSTVLDDARLSPPCREAEHRMMFLDTMTYLPDDLLHKVDRASMGVSLEVRAPFLDHRLVELAWRLPLRMKIEHGQGKILLRRILSRRLPSALVDRPKMGFAVPLDAWLRGSLREWADSLLSPSRLRNGGFFNAEVIARCWSEHVSGVRNWQPELWPILMFQAWIETAPRAASATGIGSYGSGNRI
jgi:asparagine synthase (glutamine-hydrolysing)